MKTASYPLTLLAMLALPCLEARGQCVSASGRGSPAGNPQRSLDDWISLAKSDNSDNRLKAAKEMGRPDYDAKKVVPILTTLLDDDFWAIRMEAALSLGKLGPGAEVRCPQARQVDNRSGH